MTGVDVAAIRRRLPDIPRERMSLYERDRADLLAEVDRLADALERLRELRLIYAGHDIPNADFVAAIEGKS